MLEKPLPAANRRPEGRFVHVLAFKRVDVGGFARKLAYIDLMNLHDTGSRARQSYLGLGFSETSYEVLELLLAETD